MPFFFCCKDEAKVLASTGLSHVNKLIKQFQKQQGYEQSTDYQDIVQLKALFTRIKSAGSSYQLANAEEARLLRTFGDKRWLDIFEDQFAKPGDEMSQSY